MWTPPIIGPFLDVFKANAEAVNLPRAVRFRPSRLFYGENTYAVVGSETSDKQNQRNLLQQMSLFDTDYNSGGNTNNSGASGDFEERISLKMNNYAFISFKIGRLGEYTGSSYGQSLIVDADDVEVIDGIVMERSPGDESDDTIKVFGWDTWFATDDNGAPTEDVGVDEVPSRHNEQFGSNNFTYKLQEAVREDDDPVSLGNCTLWLSNGTKNRTFAKVITPAGHDVVDDKDDNYNWLNDDALELRDDLEGRRIILSYYKDGFLPDDAESEDDYVEYTDAKVLDAETFAGITIANSGGDGDDSDESSGSSGGSLGGGDDSDEELPEGVPQAADQIIDFMANTGETNPENVEQLVAGEVGDAEYDLDAVIAEIENRM
ncbi:hypothetical protein HRTV-10_gp72 [Halorubrum tailed virus 10]|uniref:Uncharacterized protein n=1 Tax=Halorubrum tailed virus 10 TaxID=2877991 RepID=A0AAE8XTU1_9CAUD|nr:hypothetical protein M1M36_gp060 [Halorubrum tailed virus 10]UBF19656.1 hypothetical protein HRTV-10_gp72 [Halorubrum tailed virus 10]